MSASFLKVMVTLLCHRVGATTSTHKLDPRRPPLCEAVHKRKKLFDAPEVNPTKTTTTGDGLAAHDYWRPKPAAFFAV
jgi:hypothetical protein